MNEIEKAIEDLRSYADTSWGGLNDTFELAIAALQEKLEREKGCKWCDKNLHFECYLINDDGHTASIDDNVLQTVIADYCPVCGKRLEVEQLKAIEKRWNN